MPRGNEVCTGFEGYLEEGVELDFAVAQDVRIGRAALGVLVKHVVYHALAVLLGQIGKIEGDANFAGHHFGHKAVFFPLAVSVEGAVGVVPVLHEHGKHVIAFLLQQVGRYRRVHPAGKPHANLDFTLVHFCLQKYYFLC